MAQALIPLLVLAIAEAEFRRWLLLATPFILLLFFAYGVLYWARYVFYIKGQELRMESGVLIRKKRYIPFERIQTVQISAGILQRLLGLVKVQVETAAGGKKAEFVLEALPRQKAEELSSLLQAKENYSQGSHLGKAAVEYTLSTRSLLLLASTSNSIGVAIAAIAAVSQFNDIFTSVHIWEKLGAFLKDIVAGEAGLIIFLVITLLFVAWLLSLLGTVIRFAGFRMTRDDKKIKISRGLFEKQQTTIPLNKIQSVRLIEGVLRQPLGMQSVQVVSVSNIDAKSEGSMIAPLLPKSQLTRFMGVFLPEFILPSPLQGLPGKAKARYYLVNILPALAIATLSAVFIPWGFLAFILVPLAAWLGKKQYQDAGWQVAGSSLVLRKRRLARVTTIIHRNRIQSLSVSRSFLQERKKLNSLTIAFAFGTNNGHRVKLSGLGDEETRVIVAWFNRST
ncbi:MAG: PH domain-containing protein [Syntrophomonas sp.]